MTDLPFDHSIVIEGTVGAVQVTQHDRITLFDVEIEDVSYNEHLYIYVPSFSELQYGNRLSLRCTLQQPEPFDGFAYDRFLAARGVYGYCFLRDQPIVMSRGHGRNVLRWLHAWRHHILMQIDTRYHEPSASLLAGLLIGEQAFTEPWEQALIATGTIHIAAASGYNVSLVLFLAAQALKKLYVDRRDAIVLLMCAVMAYVVLAGAESAVIRAGIMGCLIVCKQFLGRKTVMTNIVLLTACGMLLVEPRLLRDDVGFQLSMLSTVGLLYLTPRIERWLSFVPPTFLLRESLSATLAATFATLPILIFGFGRIALISPIANMLLLPLIPPAMFSGGLSLLPTFLSQGLAIVAESLLWLQLSMVRFLGEVSWLHVALTPEMAWVGVGVWCFLLWMLVRKK